MNLPGNWSLLPQALQQLAGATPMSRLQELREKMLVGPMGPRLLCCLQGLGGFLWKNIFFLKVVLQLPKMNISVNDKDGWNLLLESFLSSISIVGIRSWPR